MKSLREKYQKEVVPAMMKKFGYKNKMAVPRIEKVVLNTSFGKMVSSQGSDEHKKTVEGILRDLALIGGQKAIQTKARKSIATFKLRQGMEIGAKITLRGKRMEDFLLRLISIALPRSRDFRGLKLSSIDKSGNLTIGVKEHTFFPEISMDKVKTQFGMEITISTTAKSREEGVELFKLLGFPLTQ